MSKSDHLQPLLILYKFHTALRTLFSIKNVSVFLSLNQFHHPIDRFLHKHFHQINLLNKSQYLQALSHWDSTIKNLLFSNLNFELFKFNHL